MSSIALSTPLTLVWPVSALALIAAVFDLKTGRIPNALTFSAMVLGIGAASLGVLAEGASGPGDALLGAGLGFVFFVWMFVLGAMGGGDVKLLMAFGALGGAHFVSEVGVLSVLLGGVLAVGRLLIRGQLFGFLTKLFRFFQSLLIKELEVEFPKIDANNTLPFGVPLAVAAVWASVSQPLARFGL